MAERWPALLSREEAAEYLGISPASLSRMKASGEIKSVSMRGGAIIKYRRVDLDRYIEDLPYGDGKVVPSAANIRNGAVGGRA